jgi:hypothetical protein
MNYGYDTKTGHLFVTDGRDVSYRGRHAQLPDEFSPVHTGVRFVTGKKVCLTPQLAAWYGACFLSGMQNKKRLLALHYGEELHAAFHLDDVYVPVIYEPSFVICTDGLVFSGHFDVESFPFKGISAPVYACPLHDEVMALGALVAGMPTMRSHRVSFFKNNDDPSLKSVDVRVFDSVLEDDCLGQMALAVNRGCVVYNDTKRGIGDKSFYGAYLSQTPLMNEPVCLMTPLQAKNFFPNLPLALRYYVCSCLPVRVQTTPELAKVVGRDVPSVFLRVAGPYDHELRTFLGFLRHGSQHGLVFSASTVNMDSQANIHWFLHSKAYRLTVEEFADKATTRQSKRV